MTEKGYPSPPKTLIYSPHLNFSRPTTGIDYRRFLLRVEELRRRTVKVCDLEKKTPYEESNNWERTEDVHALLIRTGFLRQVQLNSRIP